MVLIWSAGFNETDLFVSRADCKSMVTNLDFSKIDNWRQHFGDTASRGDLVLNCRRGGRVNDDAVFLKALTWEGVIQVNINETVVFVQTTKLDTTIFLRALTWPVPDGVIGVKLNQTVDFVHIGKSNSNRQYE